MIKTAIFNRYYHISANNPLTVTAWKIRIQLFQGCVFPIDTGVKLQVFRIYVFKNRFCALVSWLVSYVICVNQATIKRWTLVVSYAALSTFNNCTLIESLREFWSLHNWLFSERFWVSWPSCPHRWSNESKPHLGHHWKGQCSLRGANGETVLCYIINVTHNLSKSSVIEEFQSIR